MSNRVILNQDRFKLTIRRLCFQLIENHGDFSDSVLVGLQPRGVLLSRILKATIEETLGSTITYGELDTTFFRDDFRLKALVPQSTKMDITVEGRKVIIVDDVLFTGRTVRAGMDALLQFGRPEKVELLVLVDRRLSRHVPVQADYIGLTVDAVFSEKVTVNWDEAGQNAEIILGQG